MSKNNKNNQQGRKQQPTDADKNKDNKSNSTQSAAQPAAKPKDTKVPEPPKVDPKNNPEVKNNPPVADPPIADTPAEEVPAAGSEKQVAVHTAAMFDFSQDRFSLDGASGLLSTLERRTARMKPNAPETIRMEAILDYNLAWMSIKLSAQVFQEKKAMGILVPRDEVIIQELIDTYQSLGVALNPGKVSADGTQQEFTFTEQDVSKETQEAVVEAKKVATRPIPELDPLKWKDEEMAKAAINHQLQLNGSFNSNLLAAVTMLRLYRKNQETDPVKKNTWDKILIGEVLKDMVGLLGKKGVSIVNGIGGRVATSLKTDKVPVFAHCIVRGNIPSLTEDEAVSVVKALLEIRNSADGTIPLDQDPAILQGIVNTKREDFLIFPKMETDQDKRISNKFRQIYKDSLGLCTADDFPLKLTNEMIRVANLYRDKEAQFIPFTLKEYPSSVATEDPKPEEKVEDKPAEEKK